MASGAVLTGAGLAVASAFANAVASVLEKRGAQTTRREEALRPRLLVALVHRPVWLAGVGMLIASFLLQAAALSVADLSLVQPLLVSELLFVVVILAGWYHRRVGRRGWLGATAVVVGVAGFLEVAAPTSGSAMPTVGQWAATGVVVTGLVVATVVIGNRGGPSWRAGLFGVGGGVVFAMAAALVKALVLSIQSEGVGGALGSWVPYAMAVAGVVALFLEANAFQQGSLATAQAALTAVDPLASILVGVLLFGERLRSSPGAIAAEALTLGTMVVGVIILSRSALIAAGALERRRDRRRYPGSQAAEGDVTS
ncbi:MAG TPA: DMT family transporter [Acidimicrobiales bacterium]|nr:DMT family transporter [Acidimicrobiales bacterium]